jgi:hypothetical protein
MSVPRSTLTRTVYNVTAFAPTASEIEKQARAAFPGARIGTSVDEKRQAIVDSWPADLDDSAARHEWGHLPRHDFVSCFGDYLIPTIRRRYSAA